MSSPWKHEFLISGYVRRQYSHNVAIEIKELIRLFWSEYILWTINEKELMQLRNMKPTSISGGKVFTLSKDDYIAHDKQTMHDTTFTPIIYNRSKDNESVISFALWTTSRAYGCHQFYYELHCKETDDSIKALSNSYYTGCWTDNLMIRIPDDVKEVKLMYLIEMQTVSYPNYVRRNDINRELCDNYYRKCRINRHFEYEWKLNEKEIEMLKSANEQSDVNLWSQPLNDKCFKLGLSAKAGGDVHSVLFSLTLARRLQYIDQVTVKMQIKIEPNVFCKETSKKLRDRADDQCDISEQISINEMIERANKPFTICAKCEILSIWNGNPIYYTEADMSHCDEPYYLEISESAWERYGLVNNEK